MEVGWQYKKYCNYKQAYVFGPPCMSSSLKIPRFFICFPCSSNGSDGESRHTGAVQPVSALCRIRSRADSLPLPSVQLSAKRRRWSEVWRCSCRYERSSRNIGCCQLIVVARADLNVRVTRGSRCRRKHVILNPWIVPSSPWPGSRRRQATTVTVNWSSNEEDNWNGLF